MEIICPNCGLRYELSPAGRFVIWFFNLDREKFIAKRCTSQFCRGMRR